MFGDVIINFGKYNGTTFRQICDRGEYGYLKYVNGLSLKETPVRKQLKDFIEHIESNLEQERLTNKERYKEMYKPVVSCLQYYQVKRVMNAKHISNFVNNITVKLEQGEVVTQNIRELICTIAAKTKGRRNSKVFNVAYEQFYNIFKEITEVEEKTLAKLNVLI